MIKRLKHEIVFYSFLRILLTAAHCICLFPNDRKYFGDISSSESCIKPTDENGIAQDQLARGLMTIWYIVGHRKVEILAKYITRVYEAKSNQDSRGIADANREYGYNLKKLPRAERGYVFHTKQFSGGDTCTKCAADIGLLAIEPIARWQSRDVNKIDVIRLPEIPEGLVRRQLYLYKQIDIRRHHIYIP